MVEEEQVAAESIPEAAEWVEAALAPETEPFWPRHLRLQLRRCAICGIILLILVCLRAAGGAGGWVASRFGAAAKAEFPWPRQLWFDQALSKLRGWFAREWQAASPNLSETAAPPLFTMPIKNEAGIDWGTQAWSGLAVDLKATVGSQVTAAAAGIVESIKPTADGTYTVTLQHLGNWRSIYGNCQGALVQTGQSVAVSQAIALVGAGAAAPAHLHFELWGPDGQVDPRQYLQTDLAHGTV